MTPVLAFAAAGVVTIVAVVLIVAALVFYLVSTIVALRKITSGLDEVIAGVGEIVEKSAPVNDVVTTINQQLDAGVDLLEGLLVKKAGIKDAVGLVDGLYPGSAAEGFRNFPESRTVRAPRIGEVYTRGTLTLARLGREAPIAALSPEGPVLRNVPGGSLAARRLYPDARQTRPEALSRSPVIGGDAPVQYDSGEEVGGPRKRMPGPAARVDRPPGSGSSAVSSPAPARPGPTSGPPNPAKDPRRLLQGGRPAPPSRARSVRLPVVRDVISRWKRG